MAMRRQLVKELAPLRENALEDHPWREWAEAQSSSVQRMPGAQSRWSAGKDLSWEPLRIERVCEVKYDHLQGDRFRHATVFLRWRPDKEPRDCRYDQLEVTPPYELEKVFSSGSERFLIRPQLLGHVLKIHSDARPGGRPSAHRVHEDIRRLEMGGRLGMARLPALEPGQRVLLVPGAPDLDERVLRRAAPRWRHARGLIGLLPVVRRPGRVAQPIALLPSRQLEQSRRAIRRVRRCPRAGRRSRRSAPASSPA